MIAEKTADAIKGRKLTPFEPANSSQGPYSGGRQAQYRPHYTAATAAAASMNRPQYVSAPLAIQQQQQQLAYEQQHLAYQQQLADATYHVDQMLAASSNVSLGQQQIDSGWSYDQLLEQQQRRLDPALRSDLSASLQHELLANRYAQSGVAEQLLKSIQPALMTMTANKAGET